jgi:LacI family transcriptional regulator
MLRGIIRYQREHGPWSLFFEPRGLGEAPPKWLAHWKGDGILVRADTWPLARAILRSGLPAVDLRVSLPGLSLPFVGIDSRITVEMIFTHLWEQGFRCFGFCGLPAGENIWSDFRQKEMARRAQTAGRPCHLFPARRFRGRRPSWEVEQKHIATWLLSLPKPIGIMACNDDRGLQVLDACRQAELRVPEDVAVVGVDNDEFLCNLSIPPLSSVALGVERAGYEAAALLERLMSGERPAQTQFFLPPLQVVQRQSSDGTAVDDPEVVKLIRFIREHACDGLRVEQVWKQTGLSPSTMQRRFRQLLGRSPKEEITRLQLERARSLLSFTDLSVAEVATKCGFKESRYLSMVFHAKLGLSPLAYRTRKRGTESTLGAPHGDDVTESHSRRGLPRPFCNAGINPAALEGAAFPMRDSVNSQTIAP